MGYLGVLETGFGIIAAVYDFEPPCESEIEAIKRGEKGEKARLVGFCRSNKMFKQEGK